MDGNCWVCFCCWRSPIQDMNVRIFWVHAMECMCAGDPGLYSHLKQFLGNGVRTHVKSTEKSPLPEARRWIEPMTLHHAGQQAKNTTDWAIPVPILQSEFYTNHNSAEWRFSRTSLHLWKVFDTVLCIEFHTKTRAHSRLSNYYM